jgi:hypothetical protein
MVDTFNLAGEVVHLFRAQRERGIVISCFWNDQCRCRNPYGTRSASPHIIRARQSLSERRK